MSTRIPVCFERLGQRPVVAVIGTCDTKLDALVYMKRVIRESGMCDAVLVDVGTYEPGGGEVDVERREVLGMEREFGSRAEASEAMAGGLARLLAALYEAGKIHGAIGAGGSGNTTIVTRALRGDVDNGGRALPVGFPKVMVSTMASGDVGWYVGCVDICLVYSVVDVAGMNAVLADVLRNACYGVAGMAVGWHTRTKEQRQRKAVAVSMFGVTTPCVLAASQMLEAAGYEVIPFHATGAGGRAMERLIGEGYFAGVLDVTTTELADELVGGVLSAGPDRLEAAARSGVPQVVSTGALDMVNFGPKHTVPDKFAGRLLHEHNASVTLMRTTREECAELGRVLARKVNRGKTKVVLPMRGWSAIDVPGGVFHDESADLALVDELRIGLGAAYADRVLHIDAAINDRAFVDAAVSALLDMLPK